jgi:transposase
MTLEVKEVNCSCLRSKLPCFHILKKLLQRFTQQELANIYGYNEKTIRRKLKSSDKLKLKYKRGRKGKIVGRIRELLLDFTAYRSKDNTLTQQEMANCVYDKEKIMVSQQTVSRFLAKRKRNHKKIHPRYKEQDINQVKQFEENIRHLPLTQFSAIDECHFYLNESPRYGYAPVGQRVISPAPGSKGGSYSLIMWVKNKKEGGMINWDLTDQKINTQFFYNFLEKVKSLGKEEDYLIMDNASFHRAPDKRKELGLPSIEEQLSLKNSKVLSFPTRSPMLNPVELIINTVRHNIEKSRSWTPKKLRDSINEEMKKLNEEDLNKFFKKSLQHNLLKLINEADELIIIPWEDWKEIKRIVTEMNKVSAKDIYHECKEATNEFLVVIDEIEGQQEYRKMDI